MPTSVSKLSPASDGSPIVSIASKLRAVAYGITCVLLPPEIPLSPSIVPAWFKRPSMRVVIGGQNVSSSVRCTSRTSTTPQVCSSSGGKRRLRNGIAIHTT